jgi:hypothetical protein
MSCSNVNINLNSKIKGILPTEYPIIYPFMFTSITHEIKEQIADEDDKTFLYKLIRVEELISDIKFDIDNYKASHMSNGILVTGLVCADGNVIPVKLDKTILGNYVCHILHKKTLYDIVVPDAYVTNL